MALRYDAAILSADIDDVVMLKRDKIWQLTGQAGDTIVCKCDADGAARSFSGAKTIMKVVDTAGAKSKQLTPADLSELRRWAEFDLSFRTMMLEHRFAGDPHMQAGEDVAKALIKKIDSKAGFWTKMPRVDVNDIESALKARIEGGNKGPLKEFAKALAKTGGLEAVGRIAAADAIIGNTDRFNWEPSGAGAKLKIEGNFAFRYITNAGNIMVLGTGSSKSVTGMDFADPFADYKYMDSSLAELRSSMVSKWGGDFIINPTKRQEYAAGIAGDLEKIVSPHRKPYSPFTKLGRDAAKRIEKGMVSGAHAIRDRLANKYRNSAAPAGMASRLQELQSMA